MIFRIFRHLQPSSSFKSLWFLFKSLISNLSMISMSCQGISFDLKWKYALQVWHSDRKLQFSLKNQPNSRDFVKFYRVSFHQNRLPDRKWIYLWIESSENLSEPFFLLKKPFFGVFETYLHRRPKRTQITRLSNSWPVTS